MKKILLATMLFSAPLFAEELEEFEPAKTLQVIESILPSFQWQQTNKNTIKDGSKNIKITNFNGAYEICTPFDKVDKIHFTNYKPYRDYRVDHILSFKGRNKGCFKITSTNLLEDLSRARSVQIVTLDGLSSEVDLHGFTEALYKLQ